MQKKQPGTARFSATEILCRLHKQKTPVKPLFDRVVASYQLPANERNLCMQLVYGVLRKKQFLMRIVELLSKTAVHKIDPFVHQAIVVGLYQIFFLERIPHSAAVNEAVKSCKFKKIPSRLHGFVNGILRQSIRQKELLQVQALTDTDGAKILNHPRWLVNRWRDNFGPGEMERICTANNKEPQLTLHISNSRISRDSFAALLDGAAIVHRPGRYAENALILPGYSGAITDIPGFTQGYFQIQGEAAQLATQLLEPIRRDGVYLDGCAGLGGKTAQLLQRVDSLNIAVHAVEPERSRANKLRANIRRLFSELAPEDCTVHETSLFELSLKNNGQPFDGVLIDAPCSGTGVTGRHPDIRWNREPGDIPGYQKLQLSLLEHGANLLVAGGILVYATCSLEPEENEGVIDNFVRSHPEFTLTDCALFLPECCGELIRDKFFSPLPSQGIDGFFAARLIRS